MTNGIASVSASSPAVTPRRAAAHTRTHARFDQAAQVLLAALIISIAGCDTRTAPSPAPQAAADAPSSRSPAARSRVDAARNRVWSLTDDGVSLHDARTAGKVVKVALPTWQSVDAAYSCPPDLALGPKGEAVVTSNVVPTLWRIDPDTLAVSVHELVLDADQDKDFGFSGLVYFAEHGAFFAVSDLHGTLWRIDLLLTRGQKIPLTPPMRKACGVAVRSRVDQHRAHRLTGLCVHAQQGRWTVELAPDLRAAYVSAATCTEAQTRLPQEGG